MMQICNSLRDIRKLLSLTRTEEDRRTMWELLGALIKDTQGTLMTEDTHQVKGTKNKLFQISVNSMRIIYFSDADDIFIVNFCYKQKNKTPKKDIKLADKRASEWKENLKHNLVK